MSEKSKSTDIREIDVDHKCESCGKVTVAPRLGGRYCVFCGQKLAG